MFPKPLNCQGCTLEHLGQGFIPDVTGRGTNGVYLLAEAAGEKEAEHGRPFAGPAGLVLQQLLERGGMNRDDFWVDAGLRCRPPNNKLLKQPYTEAALKHCEPYLRDSLAKCKPKVVVALGAYGLRRMLGLREGDCQLEHRTKGRLGYVEWSDLYQCWVIGTWHPAYILRGKWNLVPAWLAHISLAVQIAATGFNHRAPSALCDPNSEQFADWARTYLADPASFWLALDIETKAKRDLSEDELDLGDTSYAIERISFAFRHGSAVSIPWTNDYLPTVRRLVEAPGVKLIWNRNYDKPRLEAQGWTFGGPVWDSMYMWHVFQARLPKGINFVAPLVIPHYPRWKYLSDGEPAYYSAMDSAALFDITDYLVPRLQAQHQWEYFLTQNVETSDALDEMESGGVPIAVEARYKVAKQLSDKQRALQGEMNALIPETIKHYDPKQGFVRTPVDLTNLVQLDVQAKVKVCAVCGLVGATKSKHTTKKRDNPCHGAEIIERVETVSRYARLDPFVPSNLRLQEYQAHCGHQPILNEEHAVTYDASALERLCKRYPADTLYPLVLDYRSAEKLQAYTGSVDESGQLQGGWATDATGFIHPHFGHNPSTGRLSCVSADSLVEMPRNLVTHPYGVPITEVKAGDWVYAFDMARELVLRKVKWCQQTGVRETGVVRARNSAGHELVLRATPEHLVRLHNGDWRAAATLLQRPGQPRRLNGPRLMTMVPAEVHWYEGPTNYRVISVTPGPIEPVWDMEVEDAHNFIANGICVHNCSNPNLQNIPRVDDDEPDSDANLIKSLFVPERDCLVVEVDYAAVEALLLGYFARDPFYMRLARLGIHDFVNAKSLRMNGRISDDPTPAWSDTDLSALFKDLKKRFKNERQATKKIVYTSNYLGTAFKIFMDAPEVFNGSRKQAEKLQREYFDICPSIEKYQKDTIHEASSTGYLRGCWGLINRFYKVTEWTKKDGRWVEQPGAEAKEAAAFKPQHAAAGLMKHSIITARRENPELFRFLRLTIHDSLYSPAVPVGQVDTFKGWIKEIMQRPCPALPCPPEWNLGSFLSVAVDVKTSAESWAKA